MRYFENWVAQDEIPSQNNHKISNKSNNKDYSK